MFIVKKVIRSEVRKVKIMDKIQIQENMHTKEQ